MSPKKIGLAASLFVVLGAIALAASPVHAALVANAWVATLRNADNDANTITFVSPTDGQVGFMGVKGTPNVPQYFTLGSGLSESGGVISTSGGSGTVTSVALSSTDLSVSGSPITGSGTLTANLGNVGTAGTYSAVTTDAKGRVSSGTNRSQSTASRSLNNCFQVSSTRDTLVNYSVDIAATLSLTSGQVGTVFLEIYDNSSCNSGTQELTRFVNGNSGTLTIGLNLTQNVTGTLTGYVPAGKYVQIRSANTTGSPTFTYRSGQEVQL